MFFFFLSIKNIFFNRQNINLPKCPLIGKMFDKISFRQNIVKLLKNSALCKWVQFRLTMSAKTIKNLKLKHEGDSELQKSSLDSEIEQVIKYRQQTSLQSLALYTLIYMNTIYFITLKYNITRYTLIILCCRE